MAKSKASTNDTTISQNKRALHDYFIEKRYEAGMVLQGWEVKSLRAGHTQLAESYVLLKDGEAWLIGSHITPLQTASTHIHPDPLRSRKLLLRQSELNQLLGTIDRKGYTLIALRLYWKGSRAKIELGLAKGKKQFDKRATEKAKDWQRQKERILKAR